MFRTGGRIMIHLRVVTFSMKTGLTGAKQNTHARVMRGNGMVRTDVTGVKPMYTTVAITTAAAAGTAITIIMAAGMTAAMPAMMV